MSPRDTLRGQIDGMRTGSTAVGRTSAAPIKVPGVDALPTGVTLGSGGVKIIVDGYTGVLEDWDFSPYWVEVKNGTLASLSQCLLQVVEVLYSEGGRIDVLANNTFNGLGFDGLQKNMLVCRGVASISGNHFLRSYTDVIKGRGTDHPQGQVFEWNRFDPPENLPYDPLPWDIATVYSSDDFARDVGGENYRSKVDGNVGNLLSDTAFWARWDTSTAPHCDAIGLTGVSASGITIRRNLIHWTRDQDAALGFGPLVVAGLNDSLRYDPGNSATVSNLEGPLLIEENVIYIGKDTGSPGIQITDRGLPGTTGTITMRDNWFDQNGDGEYIQGGGLVDVWDGNEDTLTGDLIPAP